MKWGAVLKSSGKSSLEERGTSPSSLSGDVISPHSWIDFATEPSHSSSFEATVRRTAVLEGGFSSPPSLQSLRALTGNPACTFLQVFSAKEGHLPVVQ